MKSASLVLILSLISQSAAWAALPSNELNSVTEMSQEATLEVARDSAVGEVDALIASIDADAGDSDAKEMRARRKLERKFDRQFRQYSKRIRSLVERNSEEELRKSFEQYTIRTGSIVADVSASGAGEDPLQMLVRDAGPGELKAALLSLVSDEHKAEMHERMNAEINQAGSARAYLKQTRTFLRSVNGCTVKSILIYGVVFPVAGVASLFALTLGIYVAAGATVVGMGVWGSLGIVAASGLGAGAGMSTFAKFTTSPARNCKLVKRQP